MTLILLFFLDLNPEITNELKSLNEFQINKTIRQSEENLSLFKLVFTPADLHQHLIVTGVYSCDHISCLETSCVWVSDRENNRILTNTTGVLLHRVEDFCYCDIFTCNGLHTVNRESELFYIDRSFNIIKLTADTKTTTLFLNTADTTWRPRCGSTGRDVQRRHKNRQDNPVQPGRTTNTDDRTRHQWTRDI